MCSSRRQDIPQATLRVEPSPGGVCERGQLELVRVYDDSGDKLKFARYLLLSSSVFSLVLTVHAASGGAVQPHTALNLVRSWAERIVPEIALRAQMTP